MELNPWAIAGMAAVGLFTFWLGHASSRSAVSTPDFLVARRAVRARRNAAALAGEYLSAASFLGIAGLVLSDGAGALWYPVGFTAGFLAVLLFVAAPLRRSGAYTLPDFAEARFGSRRLRGLCAVFVLLVCYLYLIPQLQGAGMVLSYVLPVPTWVGAIVVIAVVVVNVLGGGMRTATLVQAAQYWIKLFAIAAPTFVLCLVFFIARPDHAERLDAARTPTFTADTTVHVQTTVRMTVQETTPVAAEGRIDNVAAHSGMVLTKGVHTVDKGTTLRFPEGTSVPAVGSAKSANSDWLRFGGGQDAVEAYSLMFALFLGAVGLPHVLARFYTSPDGRAARRTVLHVLALLGAFYVFPTVLGALSRLYVPELMVTGRADVAVLDLPGAMLSSMTGQILTGVLAAGAFAAFLATSSGLLVSLSGVISTEVLTGRVRDFRWAAVLCGIIPLAAAIALRPSEITVGVGMAFALAASTFAPLLLLGIWWRKLTVAGAATGIVLGGILVLGAFTLSIVSGYTGGWAPALVRQPALLSVPVVFLVVLLVSRATKQQPQAEVNAIFLRLHAPDPLGLTRDRDTERFGPPRDQGRKPLRGGRHRRQ
ncbi:cation acetate symporter [Sciscionella marina]|uniref:sodium/solute symporter n=1 Tax=Sciscionella marina TaxID=508770 RepID=UPI00037505CF|nr:cation acetate symporter [Sciscionella marina]